MWLQTCNYIYHFEGAQRNGHTNARTHDEDQRCVHCSRFMKTKTLRMSKNACQEARTHINPTSRCQKIQIMKSLYAGSNCFKWQRWETVAYWIRRHDTTSTNSNDRCRIRPTFADRLRPSVGKLDRQTEFAIKWRKFDLFPSVIFFKYTMTINSTRVYMLKVLLNFK